MPVILKEVLIFAKLMSCSDLYKKIPHRQDGACLESLPGAFENDYLLPSACLSASDRPFCNRDFLTSRYET